MLPADCRGGHGCANGRSLRLSGERPSTPRWARGGRPVLDLFPRLLGPPATEGDASAGLVRAVPGKEAAWGPLILKTVSFLEEDLGGDSHCTHHVLLKNAGRLVSIRHPPALGPVVGQDLHVPLEG